MEKKSSQQYSNSNLKLNIPNVYKTNLKLKLKNKHTHYQIDEMVFQLLFVLFFFYNKLH